MSCHCGKPKDFKECCELVHQDPTNAKTAEDLMRSRYSAFVVNNINHIAKTQKGGATESEKQELKRWATSSTWQGLEVIKTHKGKDSDTDGVVEFRVTYKDDQKNDQIHHEIAQFEKVSSHWKFKEGTIVGLEPIKRIEPKIGRNDPCHCGSGKKHKKCCL